MNGIDWETMKNTDVMKVDPSELVDIRDVKIDVSLPKEERVKQYLEQIGNPYCYKCGDIVIKVKYADTNRTINDILESFISDM